MQLQFTNQVGQARLRAAVPRPGHKHAGVRARPFQAAKPGCRPPTILASSAALSSIDYTYSSSVSDAKSRPFPAVAPLPSPPRTADLGNVLPYLAKLAVGERQLLWRFGVALICMVTSKLAGKRL